MLNIERDIFASTKPTKTTTMKREGKSETKRLARMTNEAWKNEEKKARYRKAAVAETFESTTKKIVDEVLDGIFLVLNRRNRDKSSSVQNRILRRIVEKRQAQAVHKMRGRKGNNTHLAQNMANECIVYIRKIRFAA